MATLAGMGGVCFSKFRKVLIAKPESSGVRHDSNTRGCFEHGLTRWCLSVHIDSSASFFSLSSSHTHTFLSSPLGISKLRSDHAAGRLITSLFLPFEAASAFTFTAQPGPCPTPTWLGPTDTAVSPPSNTTCTAHHYQPLRLSCHLRINSLSARHCAKPTRTTRTPAAAREPITMPIHPSRPRPVRRTSPTPQTHPIVKLHQ